jgi:hypothetical protein
MDRDKTPRNVPELSARNRFDNIWDRLTDRSDVDFTEGRGAIVTGSIDHGHGNKEDVVIRIFDQPYAPGSLNSPHFKLPNRTLELMRADSGSVLLDVPIIATWPDEESVTDALAIFEKVTIE